MLRFIFDQEEVNNDIRILNMIVIIYYFLPLLLGNAEFFVDIDQSRLALNLPRHPICTSIVPNMVAYEPAKIHHEIVSMKTHIVLNMNIH